jgi:hypothetical protein
MLGRVRNSGAVFQTAALTRVPAGRVSVRGLAKGSAAVLLTSLLVTIPLTATGKDIASDQLRAEDPGASIALDWQRTALRTMFVEPATPFPIPASPLYLGFSSLAVDDAVGTALGKGASASAAAAVAAHDVLVAYFPASTTNLDADLTKSLAAVPNGRAERDGIEIGRAAAAAVVASRVGDGRNAQVVYTRDPKPGVWQPPPTGMAVAWLGFVKPLVLPNPITVDGPDPIDSAAYATDFNEVKSLGSATSKKRTVAQTDTAKFYSANIVLQLREALLDHLDSHPVSLERTARLFAALDAATADSLIQAWRLKYDIGYWRPFQAIPAADTDGNDATEADAKWVPLLQPATPPYPDYVSGHAVVVSAFTATVGPVLGNDVSLTIKSGTNPKRTYSSLSAIEKDALPARIWLGIHFRDAMEDGYRLGHLIGDRVRTELG